MAMNNPNLKTEAEYAVSSAKKVMEGASRLLVELKGIVENEHISFFDRVDEVSKMIDRIEAKFYVFKANTEHFGNVEK
jgi:hypothetical protein